MVRRFHDRFEAGELLADALPSGLGPDVVVIGLARGGVQTAAVVARRLGAPLDALAVRKVGHPWQPEYAIGAVAPGGEGVYLRAHDGLADDEVETIVGRARQAADVLDRRLHERRPALPVRGRTVVLVDDGLATGATMIAAVRWARGEGAARVVAAVPVGAAPTVARLAQEAEVVCPQAVDDLGSVGLWYERFDQVGNDEVVRLLDAADGGAPHAPGEDGIRAGLATLVDNT